MDNLKDIDPKFYQLLRDQDIESLILIPFRNHNRVRGFIGIDSVTNNHVWSDDEIEILKV